jgi:hypothetical protein
LPFVGVTDGLPAGVHPGIHMIAVHAQTEWADRIRDALRSEVLRESVGRRGRELVETSFSLEKSYADFR